MEKAFHIDISGRVTGVGFRFSALHTAKKFSDLKGWIRNVGYGQVEAFVQGSAEDVDEMVSFLRQGPSMARVDNFSINERPVNPNEKNFHVR